MRWVTAVVTGLVIATEVRADVPPPIPGIDSGRPTYQIETKEAYSDHVFVIEARYGFQQDSATFAELAPGKPITIRRGFLGPASLWIVPRADAERYSSAPELVKAIHGGSVPTATKKEFDFRTMVPMWARSDVTITYSLSQSNSGDGWELIRTSWDPLWQWYVATGFTTLLLGGFWLIRRNRRRATALTN